MAFAQNFTDDILQPGESLEDFVFGGSASDYSY